MGELLILDETGHSKSIWDTSDSAQVEAAKATFNSLKDKGYIAYKVADNGDKGEIMHSFDAHAGKMIMSPPIVGG